MKICLIGNGLTNLVLAKNLLKKKIEVDLLYRKKNEKKLKVRTIGISNENIKFLNKNILKIEKIGWPVKEIKIFNELDQEKELLNFKTQNGYKFSTFKNHEIYKLFYKSLKNNKNFSKKLIKNDLSILSLVDNKNYDLIINSDSKNEISNKFFFNKINKKYNSSAYTTLIKHKKCKNYIAKQIFTKFGPIAFLPISNNETSIVFSISNKSNIKKEHEIKNLINFYNKKYKIKSFNNFEKIELELLISRKYHHKNILSFGDNLHKVHPLAGQGFNMTLRDIKILSNLIDENLDLGLPLDSSILDKFVKKTKHYNYIFAAGIDIIHEFFKFDNKFKNNYSKRIFKILGKNKLFIKYSSMFADKGIPI